MTAVRCILWTAMLAFVVWCWAQGAPWWFAVPSLAITLGPTIAAYRDWEADT